MLLGSSRVTYRKLYYKRYNTICILNIGVDNITNVHLLRIRDLKECKIGMQIQKSKKDVIIIVEDLIYQYNILNKQLLSSILK